MEVENFYEEIIDLATQSDIDMDKANIQKINSICTALDMYASDTEIEHSQVEINGDDLIISISLIDVTDDEGRDAFIDLVSMSDMIYFINLDMGDAVQVMFYFKNVMRNN